MTRHNVTLQSVITSTLGLSVVLFVVFICAQPNFITDLWWQLRLGDEIRLHHSIPKYDEFSWTCFGKPIVLHEWGSYLLFAESYRHFGGWQGVWILQVFVSSLAILTLFSLILRRNPNHPFIALFLTILAAHTCGKFFGPRPQIFTYVCLLLSLEVLHLCRNDGRITRKRLIFFMFVQVIWANLHAAAPAFIALCLVYAVADLMESFVKSENREEEQTSNRRGAIVACLLAMAAAAGMAVNPNGIGIYGIVTDTVENGTMRSTVGEWLPVNFHSDYGSQVEFFLFFIGFVLTATKRRKAAGDVIVLGLLGVSAVYALRNVPLLALAGGLTIAPYTTSAFKTVIDRFPRITMLKSFFLDSSPAFAMTAAILVAVVFTLSLAVTVKTSENHNHSRNLSGFVEQAYKLDTTPEDGCAFMEREHIPVAMKLYNDYDDGAYLIWRLPQFKVFSSTETFVYFGPVLDTYMRLEQQLPFDWRTELAPYDPDIVMMTTRDSQVRLFINAPEWAMVYAGGLPSDDENHQLTYIFIKRRAAYGPTIKQCRTDCPMVKRLEGAGYLSAR